VQRVRILAKGPILIKAYVILVTLVIVVIIVIVVTGAILLIINEIGKIMRILKFGTIITSGLLLVNFLTRGIIQNALKSILNQRFIN
jgi:hypothetical protein